MSRRVDDLFHLLKSIRRCLDDAETTRDLEAIDRRPEDVRDRTQADAFRDAGDIAALHALCYVTIADRAAAVITVDVIRQLLKAADIVPRTRNLGRTARRRRDA